MKCYILFWLSGEWTLKLKKQQKQPEYTDLASLNESMHIEKSVVCF